MSFSREAALFKFIYEVEILLYRHIKVKRRYFGEIAYLLFRFHRLVKDIYAVDKSLARSGGDISRQHIHRCGFACAVWSEKAEYLAVINGKRDIVNCFFRAILLCKVSDLDHLSAPSIFNI